ncbi:MAG: SPOR domain-containing protein [Vitreoscilla sp.]
MNPFLKNQRGGTALGFVLGLLVGLAVALGVALYVTKVPVPLMNKGQQRTPEQDAAETERNKTWDPNAALAGKQSARAVAPPPAPPASDTALVPRVPAPVLPTPADNGKVTPQPAPATAHAETPRSTRDAAAILAGQTPGEGDAAKTAAAGADPFIYFVQVGAYSKAEDAEQQRAKLALAGLRATVTEREQNGRTVHRVRLGPFDRKDEADLQTDRAKTIDPDASLVRVERSKQ